MKMRLDVRLLFTTVLSESERKGVSLQPDSIHISWTLTVDAPHQTCVANRASGTIQQHALARTTVHSAIQRLGPNPLPSPRVQESTLKPLRRT
jgi:hypothetical protein